MKPGLISILIVTHNAEEYIVRTIKSCLNQTYSNTEILILDNASTDNTVRLIKETNDERITLYQESDNLGAYAGLNYLLTKTNGEYVAIQDHDDVWLPNKLSKQIDFLSKNITYIACGAWTYYFFETKDIFILNKTPEITNFVDHTSLVFRNNGFKYNIDHVLADEYFEKVTLQKAGPIFCIQEPLVIHRIRKNGNNLSSTRFFFSKQNLIDFFSANDLNSSSIKYLFYLLFVRHLSNRILWQIRDRFTFKNRIKLSLNEFHNIYSQLDL